MENKRLKKKQEKKNSIYLEHIIQKKKNVCSPSSKIPEAPIHCINTHRMQIK